MSEYPLSPWDLTGHAYTGVWLLPKHLAPPPHNADTKAVTIFGRVIVCAAFFVYEEPSPLTYDEIMSTVLVRDRWRLRVSITHIWVNSPASRDGGRELWAIPKDLADFDVGQHASYAAQGIGSLMVNRVRRLPFRVPLRFTTAQDRNGDLLVTPVSGAIRAGLAKSRWSFAADGPIGFLAGRKPLLTWAAKPFHLIFGNR